MMEDKDFKTFFREFFFTENRLFNFIVLSYSLILSTYLIVQENIKEDEIVFKELNFLGLQLELPVPFYLFVVTIIMAMAIIHGNRLLTIWIKDKVKEDKKGE